MSRLALRVMTMCAVGVLGCSGGVPYKAALQDDAKHHIEYARAAKDCQPAPDGTYSDDCVQMWAMPLAGAQCFVDEDAEASSLVVKSRACKCAKPVSADDRKAACTEWLKNGN